MSTQVLAPGRTVLVGPDQASAADVIDYAEALIEEEGWFKMDPSKPEITSSPDRGWTLHDAVGEANIRLTGTEQGARGSKEGIKLSSGQMTRQAATEAIKTALPASAKGDDKVFNDKAKSKAEVLKVLRKAREAVAA